MKNKITVKSLSVEQSKKLFKLGLDVELENPSILKIGGTFHVERGDYFFLLSKKGDISFYVKNKPVKVFKPELQTYISKKWDSLKQIKTPNFGIRKENLLFK